MTFKEFKLSIIGKNNQKRWDITNSYNIYDIYKYIRKNKWFNIGLPLTEHLFYTIVKTIGKWQVNLLLSGYSVKVPYLGRFDIRKFENYLYLKGNKVKTSYSIDWDATLRLWYEDKEAFNNKSLIRRESKYSYFVYWDRRHLRFKNTSVVLYRPSRGLTKKLLELAKQGKIEAFKTYNYKDVKYD